jgi:hypothetical protein
MPASHQKIGAHDTDDSNFLSSSDNDNTAPWLQPDLYTTSTTAATTSYATAATGNLYLTEAGKTSAISVNDINQGQLGDCYLLSSIGEEALFHPKAITSMIHDNGNGTQTVTLYKAANGALLNTGNYWTTAFRPVQVTVTDQFPTQAVNDYGRAMVSGQQEIWPQVIEKAYAQLYGGYNIIGNGGYPFIAMEVLTGQPATWSTPTALTLTQLRNDISLGDLLTFDTRNASNLPYGLVGSHAYMFEALTTQNGVTTLTLRNPWGSVPWAGSGYKEDVSIPITLGAHGELQSLASAGIAEIDIGRPMAST